MEPAHPAPAVGGDSQHDEWQLSIQFLNSLDESERHMVETLAGTEGMSPEAFTINNRLWEASSPNRARTLQAWLCAAVESYQRWEVPPEPPEPAGIGQQQQATAGQQEAARIRSHVHIPTPAAQLNPLAAQEQHDGADPTAAPHQHPPGLGTPASQAASSQQQPQQTPPGPYPRVFNNAEFDRTPPTTFQQQRQWREGFEQQQRAYQQQQQFESQQQPQQHYGQEPPPDPAAGAGYSTAGGMPGPFPQYGNPTMRQQYQQQQMPNPLVGMPPGAYVPVPGYYPGYVPHPQYMHPGGMPAYSAAPAGPAGHYMPPPPGYMAGQYMPPPHPGQQYAEQQRHAAGPYGSAAAPQGTAATPQGSTAAPPGNAAGHAQRTAGATVTAADITKQYKRLEFVFKAVDEYDGTTAIADWAEQARAALPHVADFPADWVAKELRKRIHSRILKQHNGDTIGKPTDAEQLIREMEQIYKPDEQDFLTAAVKAKEAAETNSNLTAVKFMKQLRDLYAEHKLPLPRGREQVQRALGLFPGFMKPQLWVALSSNEEQGDLWTLALLEKAAKEADKQLQQHYAQQKKQEESTKTASAAEKAATAAAAAAQQARQQLQREQQLQWEDRKSVV